MPNIIRSVDSAYPQPLHLVPRNVSVYLGYVGMPGYTPHIWTADEIRAVEDAGLQWWAICVPPQNSLGTRTGIDAAEYTAQFLSRINYDTSRPVFLDIEAGAWYADRAAADATVIAWRARLRELGYLRPAAYGPRLSGYEWLADWRDAEPSVVPAGNWGWQWRNSTPDSPFDLSIWDGVKVGFVKPPKTPALRGNIITINISCGGTVMQVQLPVLKLSSSDSSSTAGQYVHRWQGILVSYGENIAIDGVFGPITEAATRRVQARIGVTVDGIVGPVTWTRALVS